MSAVGEWLGRSIEVDVTNIAHGGVSVARHEGRVVFVSDAIPGERVLVQVTSDSKKSFWRADTIAVIEPSEYRQQHVWSSASIDRPPGERAGGAEFGHILLAHQRELKSRVLAEALERMAHIAPAVTVAALDGDDELGGTGWRTRVRLHAGMGGRPGPYAARSHRVIPVDALPLATSRIEAIAPLAQSFAAGEQVDLIETSTGEAKVLTKTDAPGTIVERVGTREFRLAGDGFWQVHRGAATTLFAAVQDAVDAGTFDPDAPNLDLYGGVGLLAAAVGDRFGHATRITTVEASATATGFAAENLAEWRNARAESGRVERFMHELGASADSLQAAALARATIVLDPPRSGAGREVVESIARLSPVQVIYVACDPVAFARDVEVFAQHGYSLSGVRAFDLFPHTHHLEAVGTLRRG